MRLVTDADLPLQCLYRWELERGERVFLTQPYGGGHIREWTWAQAASEVRRMAAYLQAQGWPPGQNVAILSKNCAWWILADLAIWMAGHVSVPVYPSLRADTVRQILEHCEAKACFVGPTDEKDAAAAGIPASSLAIYFPNVSAVDKTRWDEIVATTTPLTGHPKRPGESLATIIYTSGTTGMAKGVMHSFAAFSFDAVSLTSRIGSVEEERTLSYLPLAHIVERAGVEFVSLVLGSRIFFAEGIETFIADLHRARPTLFLSVPRLLLKFQQGVFAKVPEPRLNRLLRIPIIRRLITRRILHDLGLDTVRLAACGAAPLPPSVLRWYRDLGLNLMEGYGMTETLITHLPRIGTVRPGYVGSALPGVECRIGENDELQTKSPMSMLGYYKDPAATQAAFMADGFFRSGDVAVIETDGQLKIVGRIKEQFKTSKGKYVAPAPIEGKLVGHPAVESCCLMGAGCPNPFAVVVLTEDAIRRCRDPKAKKAIEDSLAAQMAEVNAQLDPHERMSFVAVVEGPWNISNGFLTPTMKIKRNLLERRYERLVVEWTEQNSPVIWESATALDSAAVREAS